MNEDLIRQIIRETLIREDIEGFTVGGQVVDLPQKGSEFGVVPGLDLSEKQENQMKRLSAQAFSDFAASRTGVGDVFEDIVANLYDGIQLNLSDGADFPFADIRIGQDFYSVKASKDESRGSGAAASPIKIATLITMIDEFGTNGEMSAGVLMTFKGSKEENVTKFTMKKSETVSLKVVKEESSDGKGLYAGLIIGKSGSGPVWFSKPKSGGSWKPIKVDDSVFAEGGDLHDSVSKLGSPTDISETGAVGSGDRWNNPEQLSNVFGTFSDEKSIYLYNDQGQDQRANLRRSDQSLSDAPGKSDSEAYPNIPGSKSDRASRKQGSEDIKTGIRRRMAQEKQDIEYALASAQKEYRAVQKTGDKEKVKAAKAKLAKARDKWDDFEEQEIVDHLLREIIREALLTEAFTKTDERQIGVMARKEIDAKWKDHEKKIDKMFNDRDKTLFRNDAFYKVIARIYQELQRAYAEDQFKYATRYTRKDIPLARFRPS